MQVLIAQVRKLSVRSFIFKGRGGVEGAGWWFEEDGAEGGLVVRLESGMAQINFVVG